MLRPTLSGDLDRSGISDESQPTGLDHRKFPAKIARWLPGIDIFAIARPPTHSTSHIEPIASATARQIVPVTELLFVLDASAHALTSPHDSRYLLRPRLLTAHYSLPRRFLDNANFILGQAVKLVDELIDLAIGAVDLGLDRRPMRRLLELVS